MTSLRCDATTIWYAGVDAVRAKPLVRRTVRVEGDQLQIGELAWSRRDFDRVDRGWCRESGDRHGRGAAGID